MNTNDANKAPTELRPYRVLVALSETAELKSWIDLALRLTPPGGEVHLRGLVTIPEDRSLSEGATLARHWRDSLASLAHTLETVHDRVEVRVDYRPMARLLDELQAFSVDLLLVQWMGASALTAGVETDEILRHAPCDIVLVYGDGWQTEGPVLLSLRGGPNLTLGVRVAKALARSAPITLFHAADKSDVTPNLQLIMRADPHIARAVAAVSGIAEGILREAIGHKAIVLGATFRPPERAASASGPVVRRIQEQAKTPLILVRAWNPEALEFHAPRVRLRPEEDLSTSVDRWFAENSFHSSEFEDPRRLLALKEKQGVTISLGLPALNEEQTVGLVINTIKRALMDEVPLLDEIVLIDSDSTDGTIAIAQGLGIPVYKHSEILAEQGSFRGKGEALWKSLHVLKGDIVAWIDTDITNIHPRFVYGLLGPLLSRPHVQYVKGFYARPIKVGEQLQAYGGGRVTELVARPLLNLFYPELSGIIQPLSGEYAGRRVALEQMPFFSGYGVETGLLIDILEHFGLESIAQTDLEERVHHNQSLVDLSKMSFAILQVFVARLESRYDVRLLNKANRTMKLIAHGPERFALDIVDIADVERSPIITVSEYREAHHTDMPAQADY